MLGKIGLKKTYKMGKYYLLLIVAIIFACEKRPYKPCQPPKVLVISEMKEIDRGGYIEPNRYIISKDRESISMDMYLDDWSRLKAGDSIQITYTDICFIDKIKILNK